MKNYKSECTNLVLFALNELAKTKNISLPNNIPLSLVTPPDAKMGDIGFPLFPFAKIFRASPVELAKEVSNFINEKKSNEILSLGKFQNVGPYVNVVLEKANANFAILTKIENEKNDYGSFTNDGEKSFAKKRIMIEYSGPNTNKPLHLGHMRNDALGESLSRILKKAGAEVYKVNIINNRGIHICKSMLAYKLFHEKKMETPESLGMKGDHFAGLCYVEFDRYAKEHPEAQSQAEELLKKWEAGDEETLALWKQMNDWAISGIAETYKRTFVSFDKLYFESETYLLGKEIILDGLQKNIFFKSDDGSIRIDVKEALGANDDKNYEKVLLRSDGTSVYITQDIGTAIQRYNDWAFDEMLYVVASEQSYHFKVLFYILQKLGFTWASSLFHVSYGLVNLPSGRMKSREGTIVDADDLIDELHQASLSEIKSKGREGEVGNADEVAEKIALGALHYYLLATSPVKDMLFNPEESLSFNGNTGPYIQYMCARISSIIRKARDVQLEADFSKETLQVLENLDEWELLKKLEAFPSFVEKAARNFDPSFIANYAYETGKLFSKFYQSSPIVDEKNVNLSKARLALCKATLQVLQNAMDLILVPFVEKM